MDGAMDQWMDGWTEEKIGEWREEGGGGGGGLFPSSACQHWGGKEPVFSDHEYANRDPRGLALFARDRNVLFLWC